MKSRFLLFTLLTVMLTSCYEDYIIDYDHQAVGFAQQTDVRSVIVGEKMEFSTGVALAGVIDNDEDRTVTFEIDESLVDASALSAMKNHTMNYIKNLTAGLSELKSLPANEYSLVPEGRMAGKIVIRKGTHLGNLTIKVDPDKFLADESRTIPQFVIPLRITGCDKAELLDGRTTSVIGVRYENMLFGDWYHGGVARRISKADGSESTVSYYTEIPQQDERIWTLTTVSPYSLTANAVGNELNTTSAQMKLTLNDDGTVTVSSVDGAKYQVEPDGECAYNKATLLQNRKIFLSYKYETADYVYHAKDTLTFRNRIRDGVNEWQDENQENYE